MHTIITVNHGTPKFIELCVKAVRLRTQKPYRHVVIDNGSKRPIIQMLKQFQQDGWIQLIEQKNRKSATSHAKALDWFMTNSREQNLIFMDSDAYPVVEGWLGKIMNNSQAAIIGPAHFRDESIVHVSTMIFERNTWSSSGSPSFRINNRRKIFIDTGMQFCYDAREKGFKIGAFPQEQFGKWVAHRWCGTRIESLPKGKSLDGVYTQEQCDRATQAFLGSPSAVEVFKAF